MDLTGEATCKDVTKKASAGVEEDDSGASQADTAEDVRMESIGGGAPHDLRKVCAKTRSTAQALGECMAMAAATA